jgi:hypothetical protein
LQRYIKNVKKTSFKRYLFKNYVHMKKIIRLTESELKNIVEKSVRRSIKEGVITEEMLNEGRIKDAAMKLAKTAGITLAAAMSMITVALYGDDYQAPTDPNASRIETNLKNTPDTMSQSSMATGEFDVNTDNDKKFESRIRGAVIESIMNLMSECGGTDKLANRKKAFGRLAHLDIDTKDKDDQKEALKMRKGYIKNQRKNS